MKKIVVICFIISILYSVLLLFFSPELTYFTHEENESFCKVGVFVGGILLGIWVLSFLIVMLFRKKTMRWLTVANLLAQEKLLFFASIVLLCVCWCILIWGKHYTYDNHAQRIIKYYHNDSEDLCDEHGNVFIKGKSGYYLTEYYKYQNEENGNIEYLQIAESSKEPLFISSYDENGTKIKEIRIDVYSDQERNGMEEEYPKEKIEDIVKEYFAASIKCHRKVYVENVKVIFDTTERPKIEIDNDKGKDDKDETKDKTDPKEEEPRIYEPQYEMRDVWEDCWDCGGSGKCKYCHGDGWDVVRNTYGEVVTTQDCNICYRSGDCQTCYGQKGSYVKRQVQVR